MFQYLVNSYPPFGNHAKMGIDNYCLHPFTLLFMEVTVRTNDHHSIVVQIGFFWGWILRFNIEYIILCCAIDLGSLEMDSWVFPNISYMILELNCIIGTLLFSL